MEIKSKKESEIDKINLYERDIKRMLDNNFKFDTWYKVIEKVVYHYNNGEKDYYYKLEGINSFVKEIMFCETKNVDRDISIRNLIEGEPL